MKYRQCRECGNAEPDLLDDETYQAWLGWERTGSTAPTMNAVWNFDAEDKP